MTLNLNKIKINQRALVLDTLGNTIPVFCENTINSEDKLEMTPCILIPCIQEEAYANLERIYIYKQIYNVLPQCYLDELRTGFYYSDLEKYGNRFAIEFYG